MATVTFDAKSWNAGTPLRLGQGQRYGGDVNTAQKNFRRRWAARKRNPSNSSVGQQFSKNERERIRAFAVQGAKVSQIFRRRLEVHVGKEVFLNVGEKHFLLFWRLWSVCEFHGVSVRVGCDLLLKQYAGEHGLGFQLRAVLGDMAMNRLHDQLQKLNPNGVESRKDAHRQKLNLKFPLVSRFRPKAYRERLAQIEAEKKRLREQAKVRPYRGCPWV